MSKVMLYGCGGTGINIASKYLSIRGKKEEGFAELDIAFIDTSRSNLKPGIPETQVYHIEGKDGAGKKRKSIYPEAAERVKEMLNQFKPESVNLVIHSASGGSGSVVSPLITSELLKQNQMVIVLLVGTTDSRIEIKNTIDTLKTYENMASIVNKPVCVFYRENSPTSTRGKVDADIETAILLSTIFFSGENAELDSADLRNFLNYPNVTSYKPKLTGIDFFNTDIKLDRSQAIITMVTLTDDSAVTLIEQPIEYQGTGFLNEKAKDAVKSKMPMHMGTINGMFGQIIASLEEKLAAVDSHRNAIIEKTILSGDEDSLDNGMVF